MAWKVLIAHADGEEHLAEKLVGPLVDAGYEVAYRGTVRVGESIVEEASKVLSLGGPVVLCGTVNAVGTGWAHWIVNNALYRRDNVRVFPVQMEESAFLGWIGSDILITRYWQDPAKSVGELLEAICHYYPPDKTQEIQTQFCDSAEKLYRNLLLETCDIVNMGNLPEDRRLAQRELKLRLLYIPLRAWIEVEAGKEGKQIVWEEIEKRREVGFRGIARIEEAGTYRQRVPVGERLAKSKRLVVLGDPGSGKTTLTRWIATAYLLRLKNDPEWKTFPDVKTLPEADWLPIIIRCRDLDQNHLGGALDDIIRYNLRKNQLTDHEAEALQAVLIQRLRTGAALLILDGLDEIVDPVARARFCQHLEQIHIAFPNAPIVATTRIVGYREMGYRIGRGFEHLILADLSRQEKDEFAHRWCELTEPAERRATATEELIDDIHSSDRIERMTGNPMLLTTMALVKRNVGKLPSRRADLYGHAVQVLLNWRRDLDESVDPYEAIPQLEYIAYAMCDRGVQQLRKDEVLGLITQMRSEYPNIYEAHNHTPEEFLHLLEARTALLVEAGQIRYLGMDMPVYEFRHLTFQEYLAARALVDGRFPERDSKRRLAENVAALAGRMTESSFSEMGTKEIAVTESWRETLRLCTAICSDDDVDPVLEAIITPLDDETEATRRARAIMAVLCVADEPNVSEKTIQEIFKIFSTTVTEGDGNFGVIKTGADSAATEIAKTRFASQLCASLATESLKRDDFDKKLEPFALDLTLCNAVISDDPLKLNGWLREHLDRASEPLIARLNDPDANVRSSSAEALSHYAYAWERKGDVFSKQKKYDEAIIAYDKAIELNPMSATFWCDKGNALYNQGKYNEAIQAYDKSTELDPQNAYVWRNKGITLKNQGKYDEAISAIDKAIELDPQNAYAWDRKGDVFSKQKKYDEAINAYDKAIELNPTSATFCNNKGSALYNQGKYDEAIQAYDKSIELDPQNAYAWRNKGNTLKNQGKYDEAISAIDKAIELDPQNAYVWRNKSDTLKNQGKYDVAMKALDEAIKTFDEAITLNPCDADAWSRKGIAFYNLSQFDEAIKAFDEAIRLKPYDVAVWRYKGNVLIVQSNYDEAIKAFDEIIRLNPYDANACYRKGYAFRNLGKHDEAMKALDEAIRLNPYDADIWGLKGYALRNLGKYDEAIKAFDEAIRLNPHDAYVWWRNKGNALRNLGKHAEAIKASGESLKNMDEIIRLNPYDEEVWRYKGNVLRNLGKTDEAINAYGHSIKVIDEILRLKPYDANAWRYKGYALYNLGQYDEALNALGESIRLKPKYAKAWYIKGMILDALGRSKEGQESYVKARELGCKGLNVNSTFDDV